MEIYDPLTDTWDATKKNMPTARVELCAAAVNGKIYAIGGATSHTGTTLGIVEEYDPQSNNWDTNKQSMPTARMGAAYGVINNKIYVAGGAAGQNFAVSKKLEIYDPASDKWSTGADMLAGRYAANATVVNDTLYVTGGLIGSPWTGQREVQKYDPVSDEWEFATSLNTGRVGHTADAIDGKIFVIAGDKQPPILTDVEQFDPYTNNWTVVDTIPGTLIIHSSCVYDDEIYVFGGNTVSIPNTSTSANVYSYKPAVSNFIAYQKNEILKNFYLGQNYPNPFNPITNIEFRIPKSEFVELKVYNLLGKEVSTLVSKKLNQGNHTYTFDGKNLASGIYYYQLTAGEFREVKKMILLR